LRAAVFLAAGAWAGDALLSLAGAAAAALPLAGAGLFAELVTGLLAGLVVVETVGAGFVVFLGILGFVMGYSLHAPKFRND
jgi:hypothetical protein